MKKIRLLIVDDNDIFRGELQGLLKEQNNLEVIGEAINGAEAIKMAQILQPDMIIMDINMPEVNGLIASEIIKKKYPNLKILIYSVHQDIEYFIHFYRIGVDGYLLKEDSYNSLLKAIDVIAGGEKFFRPTIKTILNKSVA